MVVLAFGRGHLAQTKVLSSHADASQVCIVSVIQIFLLFVLSVITR